MKLLVKTRRLFTKINKSNKIGIILMYLIIDYENYLIDKNKKKMYLDENKNTGISIIILGKIKRGG